MLLLCKLSLFDLDLPVSLLCDHVEEVVEKLVGVLVHGGAERLVFSSKLSDEGFGSQHAFAVVMQGDSYEEVSKGG